MEGETMSEIKEQLQLTNLLLAKIYLTLLSNHKDIHRFENKEIKQEVDIIVSLINDYSEEIVEKVEKYG